MLDMKNEDKALKVSYYFYDGVNMIYLSISSLYVMLINGIMYKYWNNHPFVCRLSEIFWKKCFFLSLLKIEVWIFLFAFIIIYFINMLSVGLLVGLQKAKKKRNINLLALFKISMIHLINKGCFSCFYAYFRLS